MNSWSLFFIFCWVQSRDLIGYPLFSDARIVGVADWTGLRYHKGAADWENHDSAFWMKNKLNSQVFLSQFSMFLQIKTETNFVHVTTVQINKPIFIFHGECKLQSICFSISAITTSVIHVEQVVIVFIDIIILFALVLMWSIY
jgi:hypothetical protein